MPCIAHDLDALMGRLQLADELIWVRLVSRLA
jgi:hypothetical protein